MNFIDFSGYTDEELLERWSSVNEQMKEDYKLPNAMMATHRPYEVNQAQEIFRGLQRKYGPLRYWLKRGLDSRGLKVEE